MLPERETSELLLTVMFLNDAGSLMVWVEAPENTTVPVPQLKVPEFVQFPFNVMVFPLALNTDPDPSEKFPLTVIEEEAVTVTAPVLLKFPARLGLPEMVLVPLPEQTRFP